MRRGTAVLVIALLLVGLVDTASATAKPHFVTKKLPGYCGTVKAVYGPPLGISVSSRTDRWKRAKGLSCAKGRKIARTYLRRVVTDGQGSAGYLKIGRYECATTNVTIAERTGHSATCTSRSAAISFEKPPARGATRVACTAKRLSSPLRSGFAGTSAHMVNHRCSGSSAVASISYRGKTLRYAFAAAGGSWKAVRGTTYVLQGFDVPPHRLKLATVNALGRAMKGKRVENYRVGR